MTPLQQELASRLERASIGAESRRVVYRTEYLGYLPFGQYHWVMVGDQDASKDFPNGWVLSDLEALADAGTLNRISRWVNPQDECEQEAQYDLVTPDAEQAAAPDGGA